MTRTRDILVVDDDKTLVELIALELEEEDITVAKAHSSAEALQKLASPGFQAVVLDLGLPDASGASLIEQVRDRRPDLPIVILTARSDAESAMECLRAGATDFLTKPFDRARLVASVSNAMTQGVLRREVDTLRKELRRGEGLRSFVGTSTKVQECKDLLARAAASEVTVLLQGESGTGKEVAARALHTESDRAGKPFIALNCGAIAESLVESELFGHEKGAFTGAESLRRGCFEQAQGGTLFLDEVGELRPDLQVKLLRVLQERTIQRVGSSTSIEVDVRIVAATNRNLMERAKGGQFREDLFYRLAVFPVYLPALREREDDLLLLAHRFLDRFSAEFGRPVRGFTQLATEVFRSHTWPGNVRELMNVVQRAVLLEDTELVHVRSLPAALVENAFPDGVSEIDEYEEPAASQGEEETYVLPAPEPASSAKAETLSLSGPVLSWDEYEKRILLHALQACNWSIKDTVKALGIGRATLYRKIERYGLRDVSKPS